MISPYTMLPSYKPWGIEMPLHRDFSEGACPRTVVRINEVYNTVDVSTGGAINNGDDFTIYYNVNLNTVN